MVQWLGLRVLTAEGLGLIPGRGIKTPEAVRHDQVGKEKEYTSFNYMIVLFCW